MSILGDNIRYLRWREGISQAELARRCGMAKCTISEMEKGGRRREKGVLGGRYSKSQYLAAGYFGYLPEQVDSHRLDVVLVAPRISVGRLEEIEKELVRLGHCVGTSNRFNG